MQFRPAPPTALDIKDRYLLIGTQQCFQANMQLDTRRYSTTALVLLTAVVQLATCAHSLEEEYHFSAILDDGYTLHWNFDLEQQTIAFAVNVSTTGWVGFGLSPNGQMPQSDVVIGWVDNDGNTQFHVSYPPY